jgi:predicted O-methyltransferase YrrM
MNLRVHIVLIWRYLKYYFRAETHYGVHSPFVYELAREVLEDGREFYAFSTIEGFRRLLLRSKRRINITDYGAGSKIEPGGQRSIRSLARHSAVSAGTGRQLFRLVNFLKPGAMLELGTSLGISTAYQAAAALNAQMLTIEGCPETAKLAFQHFKELGLPSIRVLNGPFHELLPSALKHLQQLDYLYLDGDHRAAACLENFRVCLPYAHNGSVFVIADIHWSKEMEQAWMEMQQQPEVTLAVDFFHFGLLFFRQEQREKQYFTLIKACYKPWRIGLRSS